MARKASGKSKSVSSKKKTVKPSLLQGNTKKTSSKPPTFLVVLGILVLATLSFMGYKQLQIYQEKQQFEKARKSIEQFYTSVENGNIKANEVHKVNKCEYGSAKFEKGPLSCQVGINMTFNDTTDAESNDIIERIQGLANRQLALSELKQISIDDTSDIYRFHRRSQQFSPSEETENLSCSIYYSRDNPDKLTTSEAEKKNLYIKISCSDRAKAEHYPVSS